MPGKVAIIGGGIAGLSSAWFLSKKDIDFTLYEAKDRVGGLIQTYRRNNRVIEYGPDAFITRKPWAYELAKDVGLDDKIITTKDTEERIYILVDDHLNPLPSGLHLLVPRDFEAFFSSPLISFEGKARLLMDRLIPPRLDNKDESVAQFVERRLGKEIRQKLAEPLLGGIYNADLNKLSILSTFPQYRKMEQSHGSLIDAIQSKKSNNKQTESTKDFQTKGSIPPYISFKGGMQDLIDALYEKLENSINLSTKVKSLDQDEEQFVLNTTEEKLNYDKVILATPGHVNFKLLQSSFSDVANQFTNIPYEGVGSISFIFDSETISFEYDSFGIVIPSISNRKIDGVQFTSTKWDHRSASNEIIIRVFFGGPHTRGLLKKSEDEIAKICLKEIQDIIGINETPKDYVVNRYFNAYPQYLVGHQDTISNIKKSLPDGVQICGNYVRGVGIPDTVKSAKNAINHLFE